MKILYFIFLGLFLLGCNEPNKPISWDFSHYDNHSVKEKISNLDDIDSLKYYQRFYNNGKEALEMGTIQAEGNLINFKRDGEWKFYTSNEQLIMTAFYENGTITSKSFPVKYERLFNSFLFFKKVDSEIISELINRKTQPDSIATEYSENKNRIEKHWSNDKIIEQKIFRPDSTQVAHIFYDVGKDFELRRELCRSGDLGFQGLMSSNEFNGISTWYSCTPHNIKETGIRIGDEKVGLWFLYEEGELMEVKSFQKEDLIDELIEKRKNRLQSL